MKKRLMSILAAISLASATLCAGSTSAIFCAGGRESIEADLNEKYENLTDRMDTITSLKGAIGIKKWDAVWGYKAGNAVYFYGEKSLDDYYEVSFKEEIPDVEELAKNIGYSDKVNITLKNKTIKFNFSTDDHELNGMIIEKAASLIKKTGYPVYPQELYSLYLDSVSVENLRITAPIAPVQTWNEFWALTPEDIEKYNKQLEENGIRVRYNETPIEIEISETETPHVYAIFPEDLTTMELIEYTLFVQENFGVEVSGYSQASAQISQCEDVFDAELDYLEGDANCDGALTIADAAAVLQNLGNGDKYILSAQGRFNADLGGDGLTTADAVEIQKTVANIG